MKRYKATWGKTLVWSSVLLSILGILFPVLIPFVKGIVPVWAIAILPVCVLGCLPFMIRGYAITTDEILIRRLFWSTRLERADLKSAEVVPGAMRGSLRTCGNGGGFSFTGWYWSKSLGGYRAFVTDFERTVVLCFRSRTVVVSPDVPEDFVKELMN